MILRLSWNLSKNLFPKLRDLDVWVRMGGVMPLLLNTTDFPSGDEIYAALNRKLKRAAKKTQEDKLANGEYIIYKNKIMPAAVLAEAKGADIGIEDLVNPLPLMTVRTSSFAKNRKNAISRKGRFVETLKQDSASASSRGVLNAITRSLRLKA